MKIELSLTPGLYPQRTLQSGHTTVVIDVLRATTSICAAFQAGCTAVVPLPSLDRLAEYRSMGYALAAERDGHKVGDAEYGNSPTEYLRNDLRNVRLAYSTTNGTVALLAAAGAEETLVGSFANMEALCRHLEASCRDTVLLCSGWKGDFCIEDTLLAGAIVERLCATASPTGDAAHMAMEMWQASRHDLFDYCQRCSHVRRLVALGATNDVRFALRRDTCPVVPALHDGVITLIEEPRR